MLSHGGAGIWTRYSFLTVPTTVPPCADYHVFVASLDSRPRSRAASWAELQKRFHPGRGRARRLFEDELPKIRNGREEFLQDFTEVISAAGERYLSRILFEAGQPAEKSPSEPHDRVTPRRRSAGIVSGSAP